MKPEIKAKWVAALRSGEYKQDIGQLRTGTGMCCLGVLCDVRDKEDGIERWGLVTKPDARSWYMYEGSEVFPSDYTCEWSGFPDSSTVPGLKDREGGRVHLTALNDDYSLTFSQIADVIEYFF